MIGKLLLVVAGWAAVIAPIKAQWQDAAGGRMAFEVASVKRNKGAFRSPNFPLSADDAYVSMQTNLPPGGRFSADFPLVTYIRFAWKLSLTQEQTQSMLSNLPKWVATDNFDIQARAEGNPTKDQMRLMMQSLLADRFKLAVHFETREVPVLALTLVKAGKMGPKLRPHAAGPPCDAPAGSDVFPPRCDVHVLESRPDHTNQAGSRNTTMEQLAASLPSLGNLGRPVLDRTGLTGAFDFMIEWTPEQNSLQPSSSDGATFLEALGEQLGLKLESTKGPIQTLVIDHVESPSEN